MTRKRKATPAPPPPPTLSLARVAVLPPPIPTPIPSATVAGQGTGLTPMQAAKAHTARHYRLDLGQAGSLVVAGDGVIGRKPDLGRGYTHRITLPDEDQILSRNHLGFGLTPSGQLWISDLYSSNGTYLNGAPLPPGVRVAIEHDARITIGNSVINISVF